jgi:hypothetical protein
MSRLKGRRPSPAMIVAGAALTIALVGTAMAAPTAIKSILNKQEKKQVKSITKKQVKKLAGGLSVANANAVGNVPLAGIAPAAQAEDTNCDPDTGGGTFDDCTGVSITTTRTTDIFVLVTGKWFDTGAEPVAAQCRIERNGAEVGPGSNPHYGVAGAVDVTANGDGEQALALNSLDADRPAGTYAYNLACEEEVADFSMEGIVTSVVAVGS